MPGHSEPPEPVLPGIDEFPLRRGERRVSCHINNDLYVAPNWNGFLIEAMSGILVSMPRRRWGWK